MATFSASSVLVFAGQESQFKELARELNRQRRSGNLCDINLNVRGSKVKAHRAVLSARSSYFNSMFNGNFLEKSQSTIDFSTVFSNIESLRSLINYMYTGNLKVSWANLEETLHAAALFLLDEACEFCSQFMLKNISLQNCLYLWALAEQYSLIKLAEFCHNLAGTRFHDYLIHQNNTLEITPQFLKSISVNKNGEVFQHVPYCDFLHFIIRWTKHDVEERKEELKDILRCDELKSRYPLLKEFADKQEFLKDPLCITEAELQNRLSGIADAGPSTSTGVSAGRSSVTFHSEEEALMLQTIVFTDSCKASLQLYAYTTRTNRWWKFAPVPLNTDHQFDSVIVGFLDNKLVISKRPEDSSPGPDEDEFEVCVIDLKSHKISNLPVAPYTDGSDHNRTYFIFQNTLMMCDVVNDTDNTNRCEIFVKSYHLQLKKWLPNFRQELQNSAGSGRYFRAMIEPLVQGDRVYLCVFHEHSIDQDAHNELLVLDVHLFSVTNEADGCTVVQDLGHERDVRSMDESFADFVCTGASDGVYFTEVSRSDWYLEDSAVAIHGCEISYTHNPIKWHTRKLEGRPLPGILIPIQFHPRYTGLCVLKGSDEKGVLYQLRRVSPYISELWKFDVKQRIWNKLKPPPFDSKQLKVDVCRVPLEVLRDLEVSQYELVDDRRQRSPLYIYKLADVAAKVLRVRNDYVDETDNEDEEELYDKECRLEDEWLEKDKPSKRKVLCAAGILSMRQSDEEDSDSDVYM